MYNDLVFTLYNLLTWRLKLFVGTPLTPCSFLYSHVSTQPPSKAPPHLLWLSIPAEARTRLDSRPRILCNWFIYVSMYMLIKCTVLIWFFVIFFCSPVKFSWIFDYTAFQRKICHCHCLYLRQFHLKYVSCSYWPLIYLYLLHIYYL